MCGTPSAPTTTLGASFTGAGAKAAAGVGCFLFAGTKPWGVGIMPSGVGSGAGWVETGAAFTGAGAGAGAAAGAALTPGG